MRFISLLLLLATLHRVSGEEWPRFRGPAGNGQSTGKGLPITWSETQNVRWKTAIPGEGWSSPVVQGNQVWMQTATDEGRSLRAICVDRESGAILKDVEVFHVAAPEPKHAVNSHASPTPVLEAGRVYISYGMYGVACLDAQSGKPIWKTTELKHDHDRNGPGSSPILYNNLLILNCDGTELRYVAALDKKTGRVVWKTPRSNEINRAGEFKKAYSIPAIVRVNGRDQLISTGAFRVSGYDPKDGKEIWWADIPGFSNVPLPVADNERVYVATGFSPAQLWAIRLGGTGDQTEKGVAWKHKKQVSLKPSLLVEEGKIFMVSDNGVASCLDAKTGHELWSERIGGEYSASPLSVDGHLYFFSQTGTTTVLCALRKVPADRD